MSMSSIVYVVFNDLAVNSSAIDERAILAPIFIGANHYFFVMITLRLFQA